MSKSTGKVTPAVTQVPETTTVNEDKSSISSAKLNKSISFASDGNGSISGVEDSTTMKKLSSADSKTSDPPQLSTQKRQRKYNASRSKSSETFFGSRSDVFEIDTHVEKLSNQLQKNYRSKSKKSNIWNAKRSTLKRFFMCSFFRSPRVFSSDEICMYAKVGDLLLFREGTSFEQRYLSPEVMRGIKSSLDGKYIPKVRQIKMWNHVGIVVSLYDDEEGDYIKFMIYADDIGLRLRKLSEVTNSCVLSHDLCSLRPVQIKNTKKEQLYAKFVDDIEAVASLAADGKLLWSNFEKAERHKNDDRSDVEDDILPILNSPHLTRFHELYTKRMHDLSFCPSQEGIQEATRLFYSMLAVHQENEKVAEPKSVGALEKLQSFGKDKEVIPLEMIFKSLSIMNEDEAETKQSDHEFSMRLKNMLSSMDENNDGNVSLDEFIEAFLKIPCDIIPVEFDLPSVAMGEMVACLFVSLGVFQEHALTDKTFFHPQSFSSASSGESRRIKHESEKSKKASPVACITKQMLHFPKKMKLKKDILLRIR